MKPTKLDKLKKSVTDYCLLELKDLGKIAKFTWDIRIALNFPQRRDIYNSRYPIKGTSTEEFQAIVTMSEAANRQFRRAHGMGYCK